LKKHLLCFIIILVRVCGPKTCGDCKTRCFTLFLPTLLWIIYINSNICFWKLHLFLNKEPRIHRINMNLHENNLVNFVIFNQLFIQYKYLAKTLIIIVFNLQIKDYNICECSRCIKKSSFITKKTRNKLNFDYVISKIQFEFV
jgi:hypothetical protein